MNFAGGGRALNSRALARSYRHTAALHRPAVRAGVTAGAALAGWQYGRSRGGGWWRHDAAFRLGRRHRNRHGFGDSRHRPETEQAHAEKKGRATHIALRYPGARIGRNGWVPLIIACAEFINVARFRRRICPAKPPLLVGRACRLASWRLWRFRGPRCFLPAGSKACPAKVDTGFARKDMRN